LLGFLYYYTYIKIMNSTYKLVTSPFSFSTQLLIVIVISLSAKVFLILSQPTVTSGHDSISSVKQLNSLVLQTEVEE